MAVTGSQCGSGSVTASTVRIPGHPSPAVYTAWQGPVTARLCMCVTVGHTAEWEAANQHGANLEYCSEQRKTLRGVCV